MVISAELISIHELVHELLSTHGALPIPAPGVPVDTNRAEHAGVGIPTTDLKVRGSNPFGRAPNPQVSSLRPGVSSCPRPFLLTRLLTPALAIIVRTVLVEVVHETREGLRDPGRLAWDVRLHPQRDRRVGMA